MVRTLGPAIVGLMVWTSLAWGQRPSEAEAAAIVEKSRNRAMAYAHSLPDFVCTELIHRYGEGRPQNAQGFRRAGGAMQPPAQHKWNPTDKLTVRLSYFQQQEEHKLVLLNDKPSDLKYEELAGGTGSGEFGGTLFNIFRDDAQTAFKWETWKTVRKHRVAVFVYSVDAAHSRYMVVNGPAADRHEAIVAFHGSLEVDRDTGEVFHFTYVADQIPKVVGIDRASTTVDYDFADVGGRSYLLPAHCETEIISPGLSVLNNSDFREYRKFAADSTIDFTVGK
jgi:hypothetical protein